MDNAIILYDGICNLCVWSVQFIIRHDPTAYFRFASSQSTVAHQLMAEHGLPHELPSSVILIEAGQVYQHSDAALRIAQRFAGWWQLVVLAYVVPRWIRDGVYRLIAQHRYRLFGRRTTCHLPTPAVQRRFLG